MPGTEKQTAGLRLTLAAAAGMAALASVFMTGDNLLRMQFGSAFETRNVAARGFDSSASTSVQTIAASEDYWLGDLSRSRATPAAWNADTRFAIGDRVTLTLKGVEQALEIIAVKTGPAGIGGTAGSEGLLGKSTLLVTLRPLGVGGKPIHLLLDGEDDLRGLVRMSESPHEL